MGNSVPNYGFNRTIDNGDADVPVFIFIRNGSTWTQQAKIEPQPVILDPTHPETDANFGCSVSIDDDYAVIGNFLHDQDFPVVARMYMRLEQYGHNW